MSKTLLAPSPASSNTHCLPLCPCAPRALWLREGLAPVERKPPSTFPASSNGRLTPCSVGRKSPPSKHLYSPIFFRLLRYAHSGPGLLGCAPSRWPSAPLPGLLRLKVLLNVPVERSSSPGNRGLASRLQVRAKPEGRSWWRLPSGLGHASIFPENRPGQSEVRANTRAKEGVLRGDGRGCRRGNVVPHNAPAFPCPEGASLSSRKPLWTRRPGASRSDFP